VLLTPWKCQVRFRSLNNKNIPVSLPEEEVDYATTLATFWDHARGRWVVHPRTFCEGGPGTHGAGAGATAGACCCFTDARLAVPSVPYPAPHSFTDPAARKRAEADGAAAEPPEEPLLFGGLPGQCRPLNADA
jgi:hypothetical protein